MGARGGKVLSSSRLNAVLSPYSYPVPAAPYPKDHQPLPPFSVPPPLLSSNADAKRRANLAEDAKSKGFNISQNAE